MSTFTQFNFVEKEIRVSIDEKGNPLFVAKDVCDILGLNNVSQALSLLDDDEKDDVILNDTIGRKQEMSAVNESGLYALIMNSRKPEAKKFRKWVTSEVLPSIRKTGSYTAPNFTPSKQDQSPEIITRDQLNQIEHMVHQIGMCCHTSRSATWNVYAGIRENYGIENIHKLPAAQFNTVYGYIHVLSEKAHAYLKMRVAADDLFCKNVLRKGQLQLEITQQMLLPN